MKRIYIILSVLLLGIVAMAYVYFSNLNTEANANDLSLNAATTNSGVVFSFENDKSFYEILSGQTLFQPLLGETKMKLFKSLRENLINQPRANRWIDGQKIYIALVPGADNEIDFIISSQLKPASKQINAILDLGIKNVQIKPAGKYFELNFADSSTCFIGFDKHLVLVSNTLATLSKSFQSTTAKNESFTTYIKANSRFNKNTLANLYLDFNKIPALLKNILSNNISGSLNIFNKQNSFASLSYNFSREKLLFNGNTSINDADSYYQLFAKVPEQKITINNILPNKTANYSIYAINDYGNWRKGLTDWMTKHKEEEKTNKGIANIKEKYGIDLEQIFPKYFKNQWVDFQLNSGEKFGAITLSNGEKVNQLLLDLSASYAPDIRIFKESNILYSYFGEPFKKFERPFYTIIDNYLVMANNASSIQVFLNSYRNNNLLINDIDYQGLSDELSSSSTISFYVNHKNSNDIFGRNLRMPYYKQYQSKTGLKIFDSFCYQLAGDNGKFLTNLLLYKKPEQTALKADTLQTIP